MQAPMVAEAPPATEVPPQYQRLDLDAVLSVVALGAPLVCAVILSFASGGYFMTTWGVAALVLAGVVALLALGGRGGVGGPAGVTALAAWLGFGAWQGLSAGWANEPAASQQAMAQTALYGAAFTIGLVGMRRAGWLQWLSASTLFVVFVPVTVAVAARLLPDQVGEDTFARLTWPITYWNGLGALAGFGIVLAIGVAGSARMDGLVRAAAAGTAPVFALGLYLTLSRGAIVVVALMLVALIAIGPGRLETLAASATALFAAGAVVWLTEREGNLVGLGGQLPEHAAEGRRVALALVLAVVACGAVTLAAVNGVRRLDGRARRAAGVSAVVACAVLIIGGWAVKGPSGNPVTWADAQFQSFKSFSAGTARTDDSVASRLAVAAGSGRWQNWTVAWDEWRDQPITGTGAGDYRFAWNQDRDVDLYVVNAHSLYLEVLAESGVIGLLLLVTPLGVAAGAVGMARIRKARDPAVRDIVVAACAAGVIAVHAAGDWDWQLPAVTLPAVVLGAAALRASLQTLAADRPAGWVVRGPVVVASLLAILFIAGPVGAAVRVDQARADARQGRLEEALVSARDAQALQGNAPTPRLLEAYVLTDLGRHAEADAAFAAALARSPQDWSLMADWAAALIRRGDTAAAIPLLRRAGQLNPRERRVEILRGLIPSRS